MIVPHDTRLAPALLALISKPRIFGSGGPECTFAEKIVMMPNSYQPNDYMQSNMESISRGPQPRSDIQATSQIGEGAFVYVNFNSYQKIEPVLFNAWYLPPTTITTPQSAMLSNPRRMIEIFGARLLIRNPENKKPRFLGARSLALGADLAPKHRS